MAKLLGMDEPRRRFAGMLSGLDIHYDLGEGHPLLGWRMPDLDVHTAGGPGRVFALLHDVANATAARGWLTARGRPQPSSRPASFMATPSEHSTLIWPSV